MKLTLKAIVLFFSFTVFFACKTNKPPVANFYEPIFDQTQKVYVKTPSSSVNLDTTVLIRSNVREEVAIIWDTLTIFDEVIIESGKLAVPLDLINAKPPSFDTFLVVSSAVFTAEYVDLVFPVIPDSILAQMRLEQNLEPKTIGVSRDLPSVSPELKNSPNNNAFPSNIEKAEELKANAPSTNKKSKSTPFSKFFDDVFGDRVSREAKQSRKVIDNNLKIIEQKERNTDSLLVQSSVGKSYESLDSTNILEAQTKTIKKPVAKKEFYTVTEILADSTRDLLDADNIIESILKEVPWKKGDSIPYLSNFGNYFLDSAIKLSFDTVYIEIYDSTKVIPMLTLKQLNIKKTEKLKLEHVFYIKEKIIFKIFQPDEEDIYIKMVRVAGSDFKIGNDHFDEDERPAHNVSVSRFLLSKYEVSNELFCFFLNDLKCDSIGQVEGHKVIDLLNPATKIKQNQFTKKFTPFEGYANYPVVNVTWVGAQLFCKTAGGQLPSEAQWEFAAKGGIYAKKFYINREHTDYDYVNRFAGGNYMNELGWFVDNSRGDVRGCGMLKPNELGLYDMCGNVWEWCYDKYLVDFYKRNNRSRNPVNMEGQNIRVNRGGSWSSDANYCRVTNRNYLNQFSQNPYLGFRYQREWK